MKRKTPEEVCADLATGSDPSRHLIIAAIKFTEQVAHDSVFAQVWLRPETRPLLADYLAERDPKPDELPWPVSCCGMVKPAEEPCKGKPCPGNCGGSGRVHGTELRCLSCSTK